MKKQEEQKFDLLNEFRKAAEVGLILVEDAILQSPSANVHISTTFVRFSDLERLENVLQKVKNATTIKEIQMLLNPNSIPLRLVLVDQFWFEFKELISKLPKEDFVEKEI